MQNIEKPPNQYCAQQDRIYHKISSCWSEYLLAFVRMDIWVLFKDFVPYFLSVFVELDDSHSSKFGCIVFFVFYPI